VLAAGVLVIGALIMLGLAMLYQSPEVVEPPAPVLRAPVIEVYPEDFQTLIRGYGTARSRVSLEVRPQVGGRVDSLHPRLEVGLLVPRGDVLFRIEQADYESRAAEARAEALRLEAELEHLVREEENDRRRLAVATSQRDMAEREFERISRLHRDGGAESQARVDQAQASLLQREDAVVALENNLALYESRTMAAQAQLSTARSLEATARRDLERTEVRAPFDARVAMKDVEVGKFVSAGQTVLRLADDSVIEIPVHLESNEVSRWLDFVADPLDTHWFRVLEDHPVSIRWAQQPDSPAHLGSLDRVESYDPDTRTFAFVVRVDSPSADNGLDGAAAFPLTAGMFCHLEIPGRTARSVYVIPREAVDSRGNVLVVREGRLHTVPVEVARKQDNVALISGGLEPGEHVIISRPPNVLDGTRVETSLVSFDADGGLSL